MSQWDSYSLPPETLGDFLDGIKKPIYNSLKALQILEAVLEKALEVVKVFISDLLNPLRALISILLGVIRNFIAQIRSSGFSILVVMPDLTQPSIEAKLASVYGGFEVFKSQVMRKLVDASDMNRPSYPENSGAAIIVVYIEVINAMLLFNTIMSIINFIDGGKINFNVLPAPVDVSAVPALQSGSIINIVKDLFNYDGSSDGVVVSWRMPAATSGKNVPGVVNTAVSIINSYRHPYFIIERTTNPDGKGKYLPVKLQNPQSAATPLVESNGSKPVENFSDLLDSDNSSKYQFFETKHVENSALRAGPAFALSTRYTFLDLDVSAGKTYYYRIRAFSAPSPIVDSTVKDYASITDGNIITADSSLWVINRDTTPVINYGKDVLMGLPSTTVRITMPDILGKTWLFPEADIAQCLMVGAMLNFDIPYQNPAGLGYDQDTISKINDLQTGWGTLSPIGSLLFTYKKGKNSKTYSESFGVRAHIRNVAGRIVSALYESPAMANMLYDEFKKITTESSVMSVFLTPQNSSVFDIFDDYLSNVTWTFPEINNSALLLGLSYTDSRIIFKHLTSNVTLPSNYRDDFTKKYDLEGPLPLSFKGLNKEQRQSLAKFLQICMNIIGAKNQSLAWRSVTLGEFIPSLSKLLYDAEQFVYSLLKSMDGLSKDIEVIIESLIYRIRQLEKLVQTIVALIDFIDFRINFSALVASTSDKGVAGLISEFAGATDQPPQVSDSFYSGLVITVGGPGYNANGLNAIKLFFGMQEK